MESPEVVIKHRHPEVYAWQKYGGFPKIRCTFLGVPIIRIRVFWCLYWGPPIQGNYQMFTDLGFRVSGLGFESRFGVRDWIYLKDLKFPQVWLRFGGPHN